MHLTKCGGRSNGRYAQSHVRLWREPMGERNSIVHQGDQSGAAPFIGIRTLCCSSDIETTTLIEYVCATPAREFLRAQHSLSLSREREE
jgi:hypothetical protein